MQTLCSPSLDYTLSHTHTHTHSRFYGQPLPPDEKCHKQRSRGYLYNNFNRATSSSRRLERQPVLITLPAIGAKNASEFVSICKGELAMQSAALKKVIKGMPGVNCTTTLNDTPPPIPPWLLEDSQTIFARTTVVMTSEERRSSWSWDPRVCVDPCERGNVGLQKCTHTTSQTLCVGCNRDINHIDLWQSLLHLELVADPALQPAVQARVVHETMTVWTPSTQLFQHAELPSAGPEMCSSITQQIVI